MNTRALMVMAALTLLGPAEVLLANEVAKQDRVPRPIAFEAPTLNSEPLNIGSRRELFVDNYIIGALRDGATAPPASCSR